MIIDVLQVIVVLLATFTGWLLINFWFWLRQMQQEQERSEIECYRCAMRHVDAIIAAGKGRGKGDE